MRIRKCVLTVMALICFGGLVLAAVPVTDPEANLDAVLKVTGLQYVVGMAGTVAFSVTAVLALARQGVDIFGACVLGLITSIGGGTIRDVILGVPVFWALDLAYVWVSLAASLAAFVVNKTMTVKEIYSLMLYVDGMGISLFAVQTTQKVMIAEFAMPLGPILLGITTAIGGGLLRDVLAGNKTLLMDRELYAVPVAAGCTAFYILFVYFPDFGPLIGTVCTFGIFLMRAAVIHWKIQVPEWLTTNPGNT
ncbi:trimeric intracellular cation channel family protein [Marinobacter sp. F4206]|uniref:trimeric intracellular cation channel family protein n=1 Tax=Marinobacter sp. F4206 TaxID=2861777 RepID=UPI001C5EC260|nr:TRIC cation channel family protein [Marinobacter sp. F4206]MBW4936033.1 TRIC cation channel family protein [Marinobacter sp. F4206]